MFCLPRKIAKNLKIKDFLKFLYKKFPGKVVFSTSFSMEDQIITHIIFDKKIPIKIFTIDTGRLLTDTYQVWSSTHKLYKNCILAYNPKYENIEKYILENGPNAFYESLEKRKLCCYIRKVEPIKRAFLGKLLWITGLRISHSTYRKSLDFLDWDNSQHLIKYNPLLKWVPVQVKEFTKIHYLLYNSLHDMGGISLGCNPCSKTIHIFSSIRAGRWIWEKKMGKECGLHANCKK
ncbi:MAG TPA: phosphoadenylyl-sulfate reductase [Candidatus Angelobacter sp.]|jgi:phosphoadenosine phosphosulfate reductase|nr:phosphoadenylyl-sulfate reductase [Candidatus Angelobacter sp.]